MQFVRTVLASVTALFVSAHLVVAAEPAKSLADGPKVPILAWGGVPHTEPPQRYAELAAAGFTHNYSGAGNAEILQKVLDTVHAHGLKQVISIGELESDPEGTAKRFKDHPANGGYYLRDEPGASLFPKLAAWAKRIQSVDAKNPCYVNLFPTYGSPAQWETPDYQAYVDRFIAEVPTPMLSFDHYPVYREGNDAGGDRVRPDFYRNLEICSAAARKARRPLWAFVLSTAHNPYPIAEVHHMRLQAFSNLAYGAQVIQYFTYWTSKSDVWNFHQGPVEVDGSRTKTYDRVKQVNQEIQNLRGAFLGGTVLSVGHVGKSVPDGTKRYAPSAPVESLDVSGESNGVLVSTIENAGRRYLVVVNRDVQKPAALAVTFDGSRALTAYGRDGKGSAVTENAFASEVEPGDVRVFGWDLR